MCAASPSARSRRGDLWLTRSSSSCSTTVTARRDTLTPEDDDRRYVAAKPVNIAQPHHRSEAAHNFAITCGSPFWVSFLHLNVIEPSSVAPENQKISLVFDIRIEGGGQGIGQAFAPLFGVAFGSFQDESTHDGLPFGRYISSLVRLRPLTNSVGCDLKAVPAQLHAAPASRPFLLVSSKCSTHCAHLRTRLRSTSANNVAALCASGANKSSGWRGSNHNSVVGASLSSAWYAWDAPPSVDSVPPPWSDERRYHLPKPGFPSSASPAIPAWLPRCVGLERILPIAAEGSAARESSAARLPETSVRAR